MALINQAPEFGEASIARPANRLIGFGGLSADTGLRMVTPRRLAHLSRVFPVSFSRGVCSFPLVFWGVKPRAGRENNHAGALLFLVFFAIVHS